MSLRRPERAGGERSKLGENIKDRYAQYIDPQSRDIFFLDRIERDVFIHHILELKKGGDVESFTQLAQRIYLADVHVEIVEAECKSKSSVLSPLVPIFLQRVALDNARKLVNIRSNLSTDMYHLGLVPRPVIGMRLDYFDIVKRRFSSIAHYVLVGYREECGEFICVFESGVDKNNRLEFVSIPLRELYILLNHPDLYFSDSMRLQ